MKYFNENKQIVKALKGIKTLNSISAGNWKQVDDETIRPQYSLKPVTITGEHPIWSLPGYKGKLNEYRNLTLKDKNLIYKNTLHRDEVGRQYLKYAAPVAMSPLIPISGLASNLVSTIISNPIRTGVTFAGSAVGGKGVDNYVLRTTGDNSFGEMIGRVTDTPELSGLYEFANPGYALGGWATNGLYGGLRGATRFISKVMQPEMLAVAVTPTGQRVPVRINNDRTQNFLGGLGLRIKGAWNGFRTKPTTATESTAEATSDIDNEILADIRYRGARNKRVKVKGPDLINTSYTLDGKPIDKSKLSIELKPTSDGHIVEEVIPGQQVYAYEGKPVSRNNVQLKNWFRHEGKYRQESDIQTQSNNTTGSRIKPGEEVPEGAQFLDKKGNWVTLSNQMFRTASGRGRDSWIYYDGTPIEWYKNPGFYHRIGAFGTLITGAVGAPNIIKTIKGAAEGLTGNGVIPGVINEYTKQDPQTIQDSIQRVQHINDSIQKAKLDSIANELRINGLLDLSDSTMLEWLKKALQR